MPFHPDLPGAWWLPRFVVRSFTRPLFRLSEALMQRLPAETLVFEGGGEGRVFRPSSALSGPRPGVLWIHGGGLVVGHAMQDAPSCQALADELGAVVLAAQYRLAPEHPYPVPVEDCVRALTALAALPEVDPARVAVAGQSAGGGLSAAVARLARDRGHPLAFQVLIYPMLDDRSSDRPHPDAATYRLWDVASNRYGWSSYLAQVDRDAPPAAAVPGRADDLVGLAPAWVGVGTLDLFHDEDLAYAQSLRDAGVPCHVEVVEGAYHGFDIVHERREVTRAFRRSWVEALRRAFAEPAEP